MQNIGVILAGGTGTRFGGDVPKQMVDLAGKPIIWHTVMAFARCAKIAEIAKIDHMVVVCQPDILDAVQKMVADIVHMPIDVIRGGAGTRLDSTCHAVRFLDTICDDADKILFHDSVRPLVSPRIISDCLYALDSCDAITVGVPVTDTLMHIEGGSIRTIPNRSEYMHMQTPQGFRFHIIKQAYQMYDPVVDGHYTDDCGLVMAKLPHVHIGIVLGDENNVKITTPKDLDVVRMGGNTA